MQYKKAFTLAETLITVAIIGVVAALVMPVILQKFRNLEVETKLKRIYSMMNQAILMSEQDNGDKMYWNWSCTSDEEATLLEDCGQGFTKYFLPYIKYLKIERIEASGTYNSIVWLPDGSLLVAKENSSINGSSNYFDFFFFPNAKNFDKDTFYVVSDDGTLSRKDCGRTYFGFRFAPILNDKYSSLHYSKSFEPYKYALTEDDLTMEYLLSSEGKYGCNKEVTVPNWCTAVIQLNNWKIPDDYPFKVK